MALRNDLPTMEYFQCDPRFDYKAKKALRVIIIRAGVAGLVTGIGMSCPTRVFEMGKATDPLQGLKKVGHHVVILDQVSEIKEIGSGIQLAPNTTRTLARFGLLEEIIQSANILEEISIRRWRDDKVIGTAPLMPQVQQ